VSCDCLWLSWLSHESDHKLRRYEPSPSHSLTLGGAKEEGAEKVVMATELVNATVFGYGSRVKKAMGAIQFVIVTQLRDPSGVHGNKRA
jgi:hypothetical protein